MAPEHRVYIHVVTQRFCKCEPKGDPERMPGLSMPIADGLLKVKCAGCGTEYLVSGPSIRFTVEYGEAPGSVEGMWVPKPVNKPIPLEPMPEPERVPQTFSREVTPYDRELVKRYGIKLE